MVAESTLLRMVGGIPALLTPITRMDIIAALPPAKISTENINLDDSVSAGGPQLTLSTYRVPHLHASLIVAKVGIAR
jgi:hypothetical protein